MRMDQKMEAKRCILCDGRGTIGAIERESAQKNGSIYEFGFICPDYYNCEKSKYFTDAQKIPYQGTWKGYFTIPLWSDETLKKYEPIFSLDIRQHCNENAKLPLNPDHYQSRKWESVKYQFLQIRKSYEQIPANPHEMIQSLNEKFTLKKITDT